MARMDEKPRRHRFRFSIALMLLLVALVAELLAVWIWTPRQYTPQVFNQIEKGMTEAEVEKIMGGSGVPRNEDNGEFTQAWVRYRHKSSNGTWSVLRIRYDNDVVVEVQKR
jgi:hypothetical protein